MIRFEYVVLIILAVLFTATSVCAQDYKKKHMSEGHWYPAACCDQRDCRPLEPGELQFDGSDWTINGGDQKFQFHDTRPSPDGRAHACFYNGTTMKGRIRVDKDGLCIWTAFPDG